MSVFWCESGLVPEVEEADEVAVDDGGDAAFQREPEKKAKGGNESENKKEPAEKCQQ